MPSHENLSNHEDLETPATENPWQKMADEMPSFEEHIRNNSVGTPEDFARQAEAGHQEATGSLSNETIMQEVDAVLLDTGIENADDISTGIEKPTT